MENIKKGDKGDRGEKGDKGEQGIQGIKGEKGESNTNGPSGREWGELSREVAEIRHDLRGCRQIVTSQAEILHELEMEFRREMQKLHHDVKTVTTKIYTTLSVVGVTASVIAFILTIVVPMVTQQTGNN